MLWQQPGLLPRSDSAIGGDFFSPSELAQVRPGDVILRRGVGLPSDLVVTLLHDGTGFSHAAMVMEGSRPDDWVVVQSINASLSGVDGVQIQSLSEFCHNNVPSSLALVRPHWSQNQRNVALEAARGALAIHVPFDNTYDSHDKSALYCSELLVWLLAESGWWNPDWTIWQGQFVSFASFLQPSHFDLLVDHRQP